MSILVDLQTIFIQSDIFVATLERIVKTLPFEFFLLGSGNLKHKFGGQVMVKQIEVNEPSGINSEINECDKVATNLTV